MVGRGCFRVPLEIVCASQWWTGDLGFVKAGACVGLDCVLWRTVERGGRFAQRPKVNPNFQKFRGTLLCL